MKHARAINLIHHIMYNILNVGTAPPPFFLAKNGHNIGKYIGTKTWGKLEFQLHPTLIICNVLKTIYIVVFTTWNLTVVINSHQPCFSNHLTPLPPSVCIIWRVVFIDIDCITHVLYILCTIWILLSVKGHEENLCTRF